MTDTINLGKLRIFAAIAAMFTAGQAIAQDQIESIVSDAIRPVMHAQGIPGMAVAVTFNGKTQYFNYGVASKETGNPVTQDTLFEIGSVSKTYTATLAAYAQALGKLSFSDKAGQVLPALRGSALDNISMLQLGTYSAGGLPLQFPAQFDSAEKMLGYYQQWTPAYAPGSHRL